MRSFVCALSCALTLSLPCALRADDGVPAEPTDGTTEDGAAQDGADDAAARDAGLREKLKAKLKVEAAVSGGVADMTYSFGHGTELDDFEVKGYDLSDLKEAGSWTLGAGSRGVGAATHKLELAGDFTLEWEVVVKHNTPSAMLAFVLNKKVAVLWGQQLVKTSGFKPWDKRSSAPDVTIFREERRVAFKVERKGETLTLEVDRRPAGSHTFKKGELDGVRFSIVAQNIRFQLGPVRIKGTPAS